VEITGQGGCHKPRNGRGLKVELRGTDANNFKRAEATICAFLLRSFSTAAAKVGFDNAGFDVDRHIAGKSRALLPLESALPIKSVICVL
jgi:hypothetical protein